MFVVIKGEGDQGGSTVEVGWQDEGLSAPVHDGEGLWLSSSRVRVVVDISQEPLVISPGGKVSVEINISLQNKSLFVRKLSGNFPVWLIYGQTSGCSHLV